MGRSCCVPGCKSNYGSVTDTSVFRFPKNPVLRQKWVNLIHRANFEVKEDSVVCAKHFVSKFIIVEDVYSIEGDNPVRVPRKNPKLREDAFPSIFPDQPSYNTIKVSSDRKDPGDRVQQQLRRDEENYQRWLEDDKIKDLNMFKEKVMRKNLEPFVVVIKTDTVLFLKLEDNEDRPPYITTSFKVNSFLDVQIFYKDVCVPIEHFKWLLCCDSDKMKCDRWSKFDSLLSHLNSWHHESFGFPEKLSTLISSVKEEIKSESTFESRKIDKVKFALEQLELCLMNQIRYSPELVVWAATMSYTFPGAYRLMRDTKLLTLPHPVYLNQFFSKVGSTDPGMNPEHIGYLKEKCKLLDEREKLISVMLDEMYLNPKISYKSGKVLGIAENDENRTVATRIQVFMSMSLQGKNKDVVGLFPVKRQSGETLFKLTLEVLKILKEVGFTVLCLIADNHSVNRKMFELLGGGCLKYSIPNPVDPTHSIFLLFDSVHILKCIRNVFLNKQVFRIPNPQQIFNSISRTRDLPERNVMYTFNVCEAKFSDLVNLHNSEKTSVVKLAPALSKKSVFPTTIGRQNVSLAFAVFDEKTVAALEIQKQQRVDVSEGTIQFLKLISKWWSIINVKHTMKGKYTRNEFAEPITSCKDPKLVFLENLKTYLDIWNMSAQNNGKLTRETYISFTHTLISFVQLCKYIFNNYQWQYILSGKFQTDALEGRFGAYRRLSGCSYNVNVEQIMESERKLKVLSFLKLTSAKFGEFRIKDLVLTMQNNPDATVPDLLDNLEPAIDEMWEVEISSETQQVLVCISSYVSKNVIEALKCGDCEKMLVLNKDLDIDWKSQENFYFNTLNRGGFKCPSQFVISLCSSTFKLFSVLISDNYEKEFLKLHSQRNALITLGINAAEMNIHNMYDSCSCGVIIKEVVKKCVKILANIFLNNYSKILNEENVTEEGKQKCNESICTKVKKRKIVKFSQQ